MRKCIPPRSHGFFAARISSVRHQARRKKKSTKELYPLEFLDTRDALLLFAWAHQLKRIQLTSSQNEPILYSWNSCCQHPFLSSWCTRILHSILKSDQKIQVGKKLPLRAFKSCRKKNSSYGGRCKCWKVEWTQDGNDDSTKMWIIAWSCNHPEQIPV